MSELKRDLRRYIDGLEDPVSVQETMERGTQKGRYPVPRAVLAGAAVVLAPALILVGLRLLPGGDESVADTTLPQTTMTTTTPVETTTTIVDTTAVPPVTADVAVPDLNGLSVDAAREILADLGLVLEVTEQHPSRSGFGLITAQGPLAGESTAPGSTVVVGIRVEAECLSYSTVPFSAAPGNVAATILFGCAQDSLFPDISTPVVREIADPVTPIEATLRALLAGLSDEERAMGFNSFFSAESAGALNSVALSGDRLVVDFNDAILIGNASTSTGSMFFMAELQANLFQFPEISEIEFQLNGSCDAFYGWLQGSCETAARDRWEERVAMWDSERELEPEPGQEIRLDGIVGEVFTTQIGETGQQILHLNGGTQARSGFSELGGWLLDDPASDPATWTNWAIHVSGLNEEMIWLVDSAERTDDGRMVFAVRATLRLPWEESELAADPFVVTGAEACTVDGGADSKVVAIAEILTSSDGSIADAMRTLRAWRINIQDGTFVEIDTDGIVCLFEYA